MYVKHYNKKKVKWKCQEFFFFLEIKKCIWKNFYFKTENSKITPTINIKIVEKEKNVKMEQYLRKMKTKQKIKQKEEEKIVDGNTFGDKNFMPHSSRRMQKYILKIYECIILRKNTGKSYKNYNKNS